MKGKIKSSLVLLGDFLNASFSVAGLLTCNSYSHEICPGAAAAAVQKTRKLQERLKVSLPGNEFCMPQGHNI